MTSTVETHLPAPADVLMSDGRLAVIRCLTPGDGPALHALHQQVSDDSLRLRFFSPSREGAHAYVDHVLADPDTIAVVAEVSCRLVALATAEPLGPGASEVAFLVADGYHDLGLGTLLLEHLAALARDRGIRRFEAEVLLENSAMIGVLRHAGFESSRHLEHGVMIVELSTTCTTSVQEAADQREFSSEARSLRPLLAPRSVAVAGVRGDGSGVGAAVLRSILDGGFRGEAVAVHPRLDSLAGVAAYPSFSSLPSPVDLAVIAVPASAAENSLRDAAEAGVRAAVVLSSGFGELGAAGQELQRNLSAVARTRGIRLVGPNCLGVLANDPGIRLNATFIAASPPPPGGLAIASQSGGVGIVLLERARELGLGIHSFVSLGNKADVSGNDLLAAWYDDPGVQVAALYLESFGNARKFARFARRFSARKPVLAVVGGSSASGRRGGLSHTAAAATSAVAVRALFAQSGVIACSDADDLAETALLLTGQPRPAGPRVGVLSNAGGMGILAADAAENFGLQVPELSARLRRRIGKLVQGTVGTGNPVDTGAAASPEQLTAAADAMLASREVDALIVLVVATGVSDGVATVRRLAEVRAAHPDIPVLLVPLGGLEAAGIPGLTTFRSPASAARALARAAWYTGWRAVPVVEAPTTDPDEVQAARGWCRQFLAESSKEGEWLDVTAARGLLDRYGLRVIGEVVSGADAAVDAAARLGFPVAVKACEVDGVHKTERGLVRLGLASERDIREAVASLGEHTDVLVQPMVAGIEVALGLVHDPGMGPLVMVAAGGVATDVWNDRVFLVPPVSAADAARALRGLRIWPLLRGFRGAPAADHSALERLAVALGRLAADVPEVTELDLNPVIVREDGCVIVDVRLRLSDSDDPGAGVPRQLRRVR
jgi:acyl-CoA synthetase (NDP forming)/GNAT superfamily N-acetyltransferase